MRERTFAARRQDGWERLERSLEKADRGGLRALQPAELQELALLYRATTSDLAAAQSRAYSPELRAYLNRLTARAHAYVYADTARPGWARVVEFFGVTFPRELRRSGNEILAATALTVVAALAAYWLVHARPLNVYALLPSNLIPVVDKPLHDSNFGFDRAYAPLMASQIITNNIKVAMVAFAGGITLGLLTFWAILENGLMVGALAALFGAKGFGPDFWATIAPHGVIELTAIQIAGAAGFLLAQGIIAPGRLRRIDAIKANARRAGTLMIGVAGMLVVAGTIEGFISPQRLSIPFRLAFGGSTAVALAFYIAFAGRPTPDERKKRSLMEAARLTRIAAPALALALALGTAAQAGIWLDAKSVVNWNHAGASVPRAPKVSAEDANMGGSCGKYLRKAETSSDRQVAAAGWKLFGSYQSHSGTSVVEGITGFDGQCRPFGYQHFVFMGDGFAGTLAPKTMDARGDGSLEDVNISGASEIVAHFVRFGPNDPLCCPSRTSTVIYAVRRAARGPLVGVTSVETRAGN